MADAYYTLGVKRGCSREEVMAAFRAKVWHAHPDRGGDEQAFILVCSAYKELLEEVRSSGGKRKPAPAAGKTGPPKQAATKETPVPMPPPGPFRDEPRSNSPDAHWEPDLILAADVGRDGQPAPPPNPNWSPDLVLHDGPWSESRPQQPPDPNWAPDVILGDESADHGAGDDDCDPVLAPDVYRTFFQRVSERSIRQKNSSGVTKCLKAILLLIAVAWIVGTIWLCMAAWEQSIIAERERSEQLP